MALDLNEYPDPLTQEPPIYGEPRPPLTPEDPALPDEQEPTAPEDPPDDPWGSAPEDGDWEAWFMRNVQGVTPTTDYFISLESKLKPHGITLGRNASGDYNGKIVLPNGSLVDVVKDYGGANMSWQWLTGGGTTAPAPTTTDLPPEFSYPEFVPPEFGEPVFDAPDPFDYPEYVLPTGEEVLAADPGYEFRLNESLRALRNDASARGLLRSGGTAKSLMDYAGGMASQEYANAADRSFNIHQANQAAGAQEYDMLWRGLLTQYGLDYDSAVDEYNRALQTYVTNYNTAAGQYGLNLDLASLLMSRDNSNFQNLLDLYNISTQNLPTYTPPGGMDPYGFGG